MRIFFFFYQFKNALPSNGYDECTDCMKALRYVLMICMIMLIIHLSLSHHHQIDQMGLYIFGAWVVAGRLYSKFPCIIVPPLTAAFFFSFSQNLSLPLRDFRCKTYGFFLFEGCIGGWGGGIREKEERKKKKKKT